MFYYVIPVNPKILIYKLESKMAYICEPERPFRPGSYNSLLG
jgi:hypothetical protein